jgi:hypothetical protein
MKPSRGSAIAEFALVVPLYVPLVFGTAAVLSQGLHRLSWSYRTAGMARRLSAADDPLAAWPAEQSRWPAGAPSAVALRPLGGSRAAVLELSLRPPRGPLDRFLGRDPAPIVVREVCRHAPSVAP